MTNEEIKKKLEMLQRSDEDFTVVQTGKANAKVNGVYKVEEREIVLNNKNFSNDNALMFTAIHEYAHHVLRDEKGGHTQRFWAVFYDMVDAAVEKGIYSRERSEQVNRLTEEIKKMQAEISAMQKKMGEKIRELYDAAGQGGERFEDIIEHDCQMTLSKSKTMLNMAAGPDGYTDEMAKAVAKVNNYGKQQDALEAVAAGKTVYQVKETGKSGGKQDKQEEHKYEKLVKEKKRIEKIIGELEQRLSVIEELIDSM